jgi:predicted TIM-barrel fold metal-dependent hydrolase
LRLPETIIDFHVHLFPDKFFNAIWRYFADRYGWEIRHKLYYRECVEYLRERGVGPIVYSNYAHRKGVARILNEWNMKVVEEIPDLYCFAAYHPEDGEDALAMAEEILEHPKILGFKLQLLVQRFYPHDERLFPLYERIIEKKKRVLFHVGTGPVGNRWVGVAQFKKLLHLFPALQANVAHMGGPEFSEFMALLDDYPGLCLDTSFAFIPHLPFKFDLGTDYLEKYQDRILYGSDFPNLLFPREDEIDYLLSFNLSPEFYEKVFRANGLALIGGHGHNNEPEHHG